MNASLVVNELTERFNQQHDTTRQYIIIQP